MIIHSENNDSEISNDDENICKICYDVLKPQDNISLLKCKHKFHYECILMTYKTLKGKRQCPYCRKDGGYLDLYPGKAPTKYIHKEYSDYNYGNLDYILEDCSKNIVSEDCFDSYNSFKGYFSK